MQHYMHVGFGIPGDQLQPEVSDRIWDDYDGTDESCTEQTKLRFIPFTEHYEGASWGTVVLHDFGEVKGHAGKLITASQARELLSKYELTPLRRALFLRLLATQGLERLIDSVELVFFSHRAGLQAVRPPEAH